jgi:hypothetical protein
MAEKVKLSKDGSSIDFVQSESIPTSVKKFRQSPEIEGFYRFIFENDLQKETYDILERIINERKARKKAEKLEAAPAKKAEAAAAKEAAKKLAAASKKPAETAKKAEPAKKAASAPAKKAAASAKPASKKTAKPAAKKAAAPAKKKPSKKR